jgi:hypothetical protein
MIGALDELRCIGSAIDDENPDAPIWAFTPTGRMFMAQYDLSPDIGALYADIAEFPNHATATSWEMRCFTTTPGSAASDATGWEGVGVRARMWSIFGIRGG